MQVVPGVVSHISCRSLCSCVFAQQVSSCVAFLGRLQNPRRVSVWAALHAGLAEGCLQHPDLRFCLDVTSSAWCISLRRIAPLLSAYPCVGYSVMPLGRGVDMLVPCLCFTRLQHHEREDVCMHGLHIDVTETGRFQSRQSRGQHDGLCQLP
jgi:hypothetical protein